MNILSLAYYHIKEAMGMGSQSSSRKLKYIPVRCLYVYFFFFIFKLQCSRCYWEDASLVNKQIPSLAPLLSMDTTARGCISVRNTPLITLCGSFLRNLLLIACWSKKDSSHFLVHTAYYSCTILKLMFINWLGDKASCHCSELSWWQSIISNTVNLSSWKQGNYVMALI